MVKGGDAKKKKKRRTRIGRAVVKRGEMLKRDDLSRFALFRKRIDLRREVLRKAGSSAFLRRSAVNIH